MWDFLGLQETTYCLLATSIEAVILNPKKYQIHIAKREQRERLCRKRPFYGSYSSLIYNPLTISWEKELEYESSSHICPRWHFQKSGLCIVEEINPYYFFFVLFFGFIHLFENTKKKFPKNLKFSIGFFSLLSHSFLVVLSERLPL